MPSSPDVVRGADARGDELAFDDLVVLLDVPGRPGVRVRLARLQVRQHFAGQVVVAVGGVQAGQRQAVNGLGQFTAQLPDRTIGGLSRFVDYTSFFPQQLSERTDRRALADAGGSVNRDEQAARRGHHQLLVRLVALPETRACRRPGWQGARTSAR
jgi:hypothetical protein